MADLAVQFLKGQIGRGKTASGYLFTGPDGERKKELARSLARALNCERNSALEPCGCGSCRKITGDLHPDVQWYGADEDEPSIKIEAVRELQAWLALKPYEGKVKVFILNDAGRLTRDAQNALLKSLEEPPPASVLILLAESRSEFLDTVVSRLAEVKVAPYEEEELVAVLEREGASAKDARFLARFSAGNLGQARALAGSSWIRERDEFLSGVLGDSTNSFERLSTKPRKDVVAWLTVLSGWVRDGCLVQSRGESGGTKLLYEDRLKELTAFADLHTTDELFGLFDAIEETKRAIEDNANQKLALARLQAAWRNFCSRTVAP